MRAGPAGGVASRLLVLMSAALMSLPSGAAAQASSWSDANWDVFSRKLEWATAQRLDTLAMGETMAALGRSFVGTAYVPHTLDPEGPEALVIDFRGLDCVTFVETVFSLSRFLHDPGTSGLMADRPRAEKAYEELLTEVRYRGGHLDGYASRLHYFTDWVKDNESRGLVSDISRSLGGVPDREPVDFMTRHAGAYEQMADAGVVVRIAEAELRLSHEERFFVPESDIAARVGGIRNGDIIAATSTVGGLDIAHTGLALWVDGELHLIHAPLVGEAVQISEATLAERVLRIRGQDGIVVARPVER